MKVLHLSTFDVRGGAAKAALRLHRGLRAMGCESRLLVQFREGDDPTVIGAEGAAGSLFHRLRPHLDALPVRFSPHSPLSNFWPALLPDRLARQVREAAPDIIHLHWVTAGFMRLETLSSFTMPLVWTLHDSWAFTGGCNVPGDCTKYRHRCGACPVLGSRREHDLSRRVWQRKEKAWHDYPFTLVSPSRWLADCARSSSLFRNRRIEVIPNGLDLERFAPADRMGARERLGLPRDRKLLLFGGVAGASVPNKGFHLLVPALRSVAEHGWRDRAELVVFGSSEPAAAPDFGVKVRYLGHLDDEALLALLYAAADLFVVPSLQENLPNTIMEAMACGTPCVAFDQGGVPDLIEHRVNGYLAPPFDPRGLAEGVAWMLDDDSRRQRLSHEARRTVERGFEQEQIARRYAALYGELISSGSQGGR